MFFIAILDGLNHSYFAKHVCVAFKHKSGVLIDKNAFFVVNSAGKRLQKTYFCHPYQEMLKMVKLCEYVGGKNRKTSKNNISAFTKQARVTPFPHVPSIEGGGGSMT